MTSAHIYIDYDNDGDNDILSNSLYGHYKLMRNEENQNHSLSIILEHKNQNNYCIGCRIEIYTKDKAYTKTIKLSGGYHSFESNRIVFGLGSNETVDSMIITDTNGQKHVIDTVFKKGTIYKISLDN